MHKKNKSVTAKQVVNKLISQKSICANCGAKKSVFVNTGLIKKIVFTNYKTCIFIVKTVENIQAKNRHDFKE